MGNVTSDLEGHKKFFDFLNNVSYEGRELTQLEESCRIGEITEQEFQAEIGHGHFRACLIGDLDLVQIVDRYNRNNYQRLAQDHKQHNYVFLAGEHDRSTDQRIQEYTSYRKIPVRYFPVFRDGNQWSTGHRLKARTVIVVGSGSPRAEVSSPVLSTHPLLTILFLELFQFKKKQRVYFLALQYCS